VSRVKVDTERLKANAERLSALVGDFYCVVKCDAYGHGIEECVKALFETGRRKFAVYSVDEAVRVKNAVREAEVLILGRTPSRYLPSVADNGFVQTVFSVEYAEEVRASGSVPSLHVKLDTGMNRTGFCGDAEEILRAFSGSEGAIKGVYTHFNCADAPSLSVALGQLEDFKERASKLEAMLGAPLVKHAAATAAALRIKEARLDLCRIGLGIYGVLPDNCEGLCELAPVMSFTAPTVSLRWVKKGQTVGYGCDTVLSRDSYIATVSVGYGFGLPRSARGFSPYICGVRVPIIGRICMDRCMLDLSDALDGGLRVRVGDRAEFISDKLPVSELSAAEGTVPYETLCRIGRMNKIRKG
jgi:alanine racemase